MCTLFANLYVLLTRCPHMVYMGSPYIFYIYMITCGWLGCIKSCQNAQCMCMLPCTFNYLQFQVLIFTQWVDEFSSENQLNNRFHSDGDGSPRCVSWRSCCSLYMRYIILQTLCNNLYMY